MFTLPGLRRSSPIPVLAGQLLSIGSLSLMYSDLVSDAADRASPERRFVSRVKRTAHSFLADPKTMEMLAPTPFVATACFSS
jgi:hypothetical protein